MGGLLGTPYIFCLLFIKTEAWPILKSNLHHFDLNSFPWMNKKIMERGSQGALLPFFKEESIVVLTDSIAILQIPGIVWIYFFNTNVYKLI